MDMYKVTPESGQTIMVLANTPHDAAIHYTLIRSKQTGDDDIFPSPIDGPRRYALCETFGLYRLSSSSQGYECVEKIQVIKERKPEYEQAE